MFHVFEDWNPSKLFSLQENKGYYRMKRWNSDSLKVINCSFMKEKKYKWEAKLTPQNKADG